MWRSQHLKASNKASTCILAKWIGEGHINTIIILQKHVLAYWNTSLIKDY